MEDTNIGIMKIFDFLNINKEKLNQDSDFIDYFNDNKNGWVNSNWNHEYLIQKIDNNRLYLKSLTSEMGVHSSIKLQINEKRNFDIEAKIKITGTGDLFYFTMDFGIKRNNSERKIIEGQIIPTTYGAKNFYFGYSNTKEYLITKWVFGKETYYKRDYSDDINVDDFNVLRISKFKKNMFYYINDKLVFRKRYQKLFGSGFGFGTAPNSELIVEYVKLKYK